MYYLYRKTHYVTGLKYLGKTKNDPFKYKGSGLYWRAHLNKHGNKVTTEIVKICSTLEELRYWGEYYSMIWDIVNSPEWANMKIEIGDGGSHKGVNLGRKHSDETKLKISNSKKDKPAPWAQYPRSDETKKKLREINKGKKLSEETKNKIINTRIKNGNLTHTEETKNKMKRPKSDNTKENMKIAQNLRRETEGVSMWITNGKHNTTVLDTSTIPDGWRKGRTTDQIPPSQKGKFWINNGIENTMSSTIPNGWYKGRLNFKRRKL